MEQEYVSCEVKSLRQRVGEKAGGDTQLGRGVGGGYMGKYVNTQPHSGNNTYSKLSGQFGDLPQAVWRRTLGICLTLWVSVVTLHKLRLEGEVPGPSSSATGGL